MCVQSHPKQKTACVLEGARIRTCWSPSSRVDPTHSASVMLNILWCSLVFRNQDNTKKVVVNVETELEVHRMMVGI